MKSFLLFVAFLCALTLSSSSVPSASSAAGIPRSQRAEMKFDHPVQLMGVTLQGEYLFVHDDAAMMRGEACTHVYKGLAESKGKLVVAFHCIPAARDKVAYFTVRTSQNSVGQNELTEFQFAGSSEAHMVPAGAHEGHVNIAPLN